MGKVRKFAGGAPKAGLKVSQAQDTEAAQGMQEPCFQALAVTAPVGIYVTDAQGKCTYVNPRWCEMTGLTAEQAHGNGWLEGLHPEDRDRIPGAWERMIASEGKWGAEYRFRNGQGEAVWVLGHATAMRNANGEITGYVGVTVDITESRKAKDSLADSEEKYRRIVETAQEGVWIIDADSKTQFVNTCMADMLGYTPDEMMGASLFDFMDDQARALAAANVDRRRQGIKEIHEFTFRRKDGGELHARLSTNPLLDDDGQYLGALGMVADVTEQKRTQDALARRVEFERIVNEISSDFLGMGVDQTDAGINRALEAVGRFTGADRAYVFRIYDDGRLMDNTHEWCAEGITPHIDDIQGAKLDDLPWFAERIRSKTVFHVPDVSALPTEARVERELFESQSIQSLVAVPMIESGVLAGFLGFDAVRDKRAWTTDDQSLLRLIGQTFTHALARRQAAAVLHESEERLRSTMSSMDDLIFVLDKEGVFQTYYESASGKELYIPPEEFLGKSFRDVLPTDVAELLGEALDAAIATNTVQQFDYAIDIDDQQRWFGANVSTRWAPDGTCSGVTVVARNITERKQVEEALRESEKRYRLVVDHLPVVVSSAFVTAAGPELFISGRVETLTGYTAEEFKADRNLYDRILHPDDRKWYWQEVTALIHSGAKLDVEYRIVAKDGTVKWVHDRVDITRNEDGSALRVDGILADITARRRLEERLNQSQKMEALGQLAGGVAHDFRNQLAIIRGYAEMLARRSLVTEQGLESVTEILNAVDRSARLTHNLMVFSSGELAQPQALVLADVVEEIAGTLDAMLSDDIEVVTDLVDRNLAIQADPTQLHQALMNLAINAQDAMETGGRLTFRVNRTVLADGAADGLGLLPKPYATLTVTDTGVGMDEQTRRCAFDPFFTTKDPGEGTGLGLAMVYGFVNECGGAVDCDSAPGEGTRLTLYFPVADHEPVEAPPASDDDVQPRGRGAIMVVEDETPLRQMMALSLQEAGFDVQSCATPAEALQRLERDEALDALVTDVVMPGMSGADLVIRFRRKWPDLNVLFVTGYGGQELGRRGMEQLNADLLLKPFGHDQLVLAVNEAMKRRSPRRTSTR